VWEGLSGVERGLDGLMKTVYRVPKSFLRFILGAFMGYQEEVKRRSDGKRFLVDLSNRWILPTPGGLMTSYKATQVIPSCNVTKPLLEDLEGYFVLRGLNRYSMFDTKRNGSATKTIQWILSGVRGVLVFGVLAMYLRKLVFNI
jgi:hypothetical protein